MAITLTQLLVRYLRFHIYIQQIRSVREVDLLLSVRKWKIQIRMQIDMSNVPCTESWFLNQLQILIKIILVSLSSKFYVQEPQNSKSKVQTMKSLFQPSMWIWLNWKTLSMTILQNGQNGLLAHHIANDRDIESVLVNLNVTMRQMVFQSPFSVQEEVEQLF